MGTVEDIRQNLLPVQKLLQSWVLDLIHDNRPMWRDNGVDVGRAEIFDVLGKVDKTDNKVTFVTTVGPFRINLGTCPGGKEYTP